MAAARPACRPLNFDVRAMAQALSLPAFFLAASACSLACANCVDEKFSTFLIKFASRPPFQAERTVAPLPVVLGDGRAAERRAETWSRDQIAGLKSPLMPTPSFRGKHGVKERINREGGEGFSVYHFIEEADSYRLRYLFRSVNGCWHLVRYENSSL